MKKRMVKAGYVDLTSEEVERAIIYWLAEAVTPPVYAEALVDVDDKSGATLRIWTEEVPFEGPK
jgi:hypothetical protein